jgi:hypothetical protein
MCSAMYGYSSTGKSSRNFAAISESSSFVSIGKLSAPGA